MPGLEKQICSAYDCDSKIYFKIACIDYKGRVYCTPKCADASLEREGIEDRLQYFGFLEDKPTPHISPSQRPN